MYLDFPDLGQVTKFNPKMQHFKRVLDLTWSKESGFFNWLLNIKNFFFRMALKTREMWSESH